MTGNGTGGLRLIFLIRYQRASGLATLRDGVAIEAGTDPLDIHRVHPGAVPGASSREDAVWKAS